VTRRFFFYLIGVGIGIVISILFFGDREIEFAYLPNARTLKHLRSQDLVYSEQAVCLMNCMKITESAFERMFYEGDLDVDFSDSDVKSPCKTYAIDVENSKYLSRLLIDDCDSVSTILTFGPTTCSCN
jgi:hypothetical protein